MAKLTWLGEDELHRTVTPQGVTVDAAGPSFTTWRNIKFNKGQAVDVTDADIIAKAKRNPFFKVEEGEEPQRRGPGRPKKVDVEVETPALEVTDDGHDQDKA